MGQTGTGQVSYEHMNIKNVVASVQRRIEEIIPQLIDALNDFDKQYFLAHKDCKPTSVYFSTGESDQIGYHVAFERYCQHTVLSIVRIPLVAFENDDVLKRWVEKEKEERIAAEEDYKQRRYKHYLELKEEFEK